MTIQAQVLALMKELNERLGTATILITHNLGCASSICDRILVMYGGKIMEEGSTEEIFYEPRHPYTMGLLNSVPKVSGEQSKKRLVPIPGNAAGYAPSAHGLSLLPAVPVCHEGLCLHGCAGVYAERYPSGQLLHVSPGGAGEGGV